MAKKKAEAAATAETRPERPAALVLGNNTRCGRCVFFGSMHPTFKGDCRDVFGVKLKSRACTDFELHINPERYRHDPTVVQFNAAAISNDFANAAMVLQEEVKELAGRVFQRASVRSGDAKRLHPVRAVLRKEQDTSALVPFFEEVQRWQDRVSEILSQTLINQGRLELLWQHAESYLARRYPELRALKPEAVRIGTLRAILNEVYTARVYLDTLHSQCDQAIRNFGSEHRSLVEIQVAARTPVAIPKSSIERGERGERGHIPRGNDRHRGKNG